MFIWFIALFGTFLWLYEPSTGGILKVISLFAFSCFTRGYNDVTIFFYLSDDEEDEDVHLAPSSADDAPRVTNLVKGSDGGVNNVPSRPSGRIVGIIKRNWKS